MLHETLHRFDPSEPRDDRGRWTDGTSSVSFISPNVGTLNFDDAVAALDSDRQRKITKASNEIDKALGINSENHPAIGAWADGAENSMMVISPGASSAQVRAATAMKGYIADQKAVLVFHPAHAGQHVLASFDVEGKPGELHDKLLASNLAFHTLEPIGEKRFRVHVFASDDATIDAVAKASETFGVVPDFTRGDGEFIGTTKEDGTDREQRDDARRQYEQVIQDIARSGALEGQDIGATWDEIRDRWSQSEAESGKPRHPGKGYSKDAKLIDGVIHTSNVEDAQLALSQDRKVDLKQLKQVSTLIKRLGETAAKMEAQGESAPVFNLCNVSVSGTNVFCAGNKGIPRAEMPVIPAKRTKEFIKHLKERGYSVEKDEEQARNLRATQSEISGAKVAASMKRIKEEGFYKRLVVSRDDYILDGHHTWAGQLGVDAKDGNLKDDDRSVKIARVDIPIIKLIEEAERFTRGAGKKPATEKPKGYAQLTMRQASLVLPPDLFKKYYGAACEFFSANAHLTPRNFDEIRVVVRSAPLYVRRDLRNVDAFTAWAHAHGFDEINDDLHVTVLYSKAPVEWDDMGDRDTRVLVVPAGGERSLEVLDGGAVVLVFASTVLARRHGEMLGDGASSDYDAYVPHITINMSGDIPPGAVPYDGELVFGPEIFETIEEKEFDPSKHPRVPAGSPEGGQFGTSGSASNYGLVPGDVEKFRQLKKDWARINNDLLAYVDDPGGPESKALSDKLEAIVNEMQTLHADPGGPEGVGLPGGPRDVVIVGAGPGGLAAGINGAAEGLDTLVVEANVTPGGQAKFSSRIENFPGFPIGVTGERLTQNMFEQAKRLGAGTKLGVRVTGMDYDESTGLKRITLSNGEKIETRAVILAGGVEFRKMTFPGSEGPGVITGDGKALAKVGAGGTVCVIGGSNGAAQAALGCARVCDHIYLLARSPIVDSMSDYQIEALRGNPKITVIEGDAIAKLNRDASGNPVSMETAKGKTIPVKAVGAFVGSVPDTKWVPADVVAKGGRITTNKNFATSIPGVYAVGDMRDGAIGRVGVAVGEGQFALREVNVFLDEQKIKAQEAAAATKADKEIKKATLPVEDLFDLDRTDPWFGQTVDGVTPLKKKKTKTDKDFDPDKHPRVPAGDPHGGEFASSGGGETSPEGTSENFDPAVVEVGGDEWNRKVARKLEREYQAAKPALDKLTNEAVRAGELTDELNEKPKDTWDSLSAEQQDMAYQQWFDENKDNYETGATAKEAWDKLSDEEKVEFALHGPVDTDEEEEEEEAPYVPESWDMLSEDQQTDTYEKWKSDNYSSFYDSEVENWSSESAPDDARVSVRDDFNSGSEDEWARDALKEHREKRADDGFSDFPFTDDELIQAMKLDVGEGYGGGSYWEKHFDVTFDDEKLQEIGAARAGIDSDQPQFEGMEAPDYSKLLTESMRTDITDVIMDAFKERAEKVADNMEPPDYLNEGVDEQLESYWGEMDDDQKFKYAEQYETFEVPESESKDPTISSNVDPMKVEALPKKYDPLNETTGADYIRTQRLAHYLSIMRARQLIKERLGLDLYPRIDTVSAVDKRLWVDWKGSSTSQNGMLLQIATAEELGGRLNTKTAINLPDAESAKNYADAQYKTIGGYKGVLAYIRAKWETSQFLLDKAGQQELQLYRGLDLGRHDQDRFNAAMQEKLLHGKQMIDVTYPSGSTNKYTKLPTVKVDRNGAASTTTDINVANGWARGGTGKITLRAVVPRTAAISIPAYGINVHGEHEVVVAGTAWKAWDAWAGGAPRLSDVPIGPNGSGIGKNAPVQ